MQHAVPPQLSLERVSPEGGTYLGESEAHFVMVETLLEKENLTLVMKDKTGMFSVHGEEIEFFKFLKSLVRMKHNV